MNPTPRFSVVIPCYGHARFLPILVQSLWEQTFQDFEIVAVDDGSPDDTKLVLKELAASSPQPLRVISTPNQGAHAALNVGWESAEGRYVAFANDDDAFHPERLEVFDRAARQVPGFRWGFSGVQAIDEDGSALDSEQIPDLTRQIAVQLSGIPLEAVAALPRRNTAVSSGNLVVDRGLLSRVGGFTDLRFAHDWELTLRLLAICPPYVAERRLYSYRVHLGNAFAAQSKRQGARLADAEAQWIIGAQRAREESRAAFEPAVSQPNEVDPDEAFAIKATLWAVRKLRSAPVLYAAARGTAKRARRLRSR